MKLDTFTQSKIRWHLGYNLTSVPAGDISRLEEAMNNVQDSFWFSKIVEQIGRCDEAEKSIIDWIFEKTYGRKISYC